MTAEIGVFDDLGTLLDDWRTHLRARNCSKATIDSYIRCAIALRLFLVEKGMPTSVGAIKREQVEAFLAHLADRVSPATTAKHYRSLQQLFRWLRMTARSRPHRWCGCGRRPFPSSPSRSSPTRC